eukprot:TRINITY_DN5513_c0_g1_i1.p1 TRINITY_DN5513_c0_g1~~TRINITY_DN5513_c0_g1_i1.p1  ORF type:complete len:725 (+),score=204.47 TRINITY_DN5513_c0_g1_i1:132-2306(+)
MDDRGAAMEARKKALQAEFVKLDLEAKKLETVKLEFSEKRRMLQERHRSERATLERQRLSLVAKQSQELNELKRLEDKIGVKLVRGESVDLNVLAKTPSFERNRREENDSEIEVDDVGPFQIFTSTKRHKYPKNKKGNNNNSKHSTSKKNKKKKEETPRYDESDEYSSVEEGEEGTGFASTSSGEENEAEMSHDDDYAPHKKVQNHHVESRSAPPPSKKIVKNVFKTNNLDKKWFEMYDNLKEWKEEHGNINISQKSNKSLCYWVYMQKIQARRETLRNDRRNLLIELGLPLCSSWSEMFNQLKNYKKQHNTVEIDIEQDQELYEWVREQLKSWKKGLLIAERVNQLKSTGLNLDMRFTARKKQEKEEEAGEDEESEDEFEDKDEEEEDKTARKGRPAKSDVVDAWMQNYNEMRVFREKYFHSHPDRNLSKRLSKWCENQRYLILRDALTPERYNLVCDIGLDLTLWDDMYGALIKHKEMQGHLNYIDGDETLSLWFAKQKRLWSNGKLTEEQSSQLEALGLDREGDSRTPSRRSALVKQKMGLTDNHPTSYDETHRRKRKRAEPEVPAKKKPLTLTDDPLWNSKFEMLIAFKDSHGHCYPSKQSIPKVYRWLIEQKSQEKKRLLEPQKKQLMSEIGVHFDSDWDKLFTKVKSAKVAADPDKPLHEIITDVSLLHWLSRQLLGWTRGLLTDTKKELFRKIGLDPTDYAELYKCLFTHGKGEDDS